MATFVLIEWTFRELPEGSPGMNQIREIQRCNFAVRPEYRRAWESRKSSFNPAFVQWMENSVVNQ
jgi:hypothetical protein